LKNENSFEIKINFLNIKNNMTFINIFKLVICNTLNLLKDFDEKSKTLSGIKKNKIKKGKDAIKENQNNIFLTYSFLNSKLYHLIKKYLDRNELTKLNQVLFFDENKYFKLFSKNLLNLIENFNHYNNEIYEVKNQKKDEKFYKELILYYYKNENIFEMNEGEESKIKFQKEILLNEFILNLNNFNIDFIINNFEIFFNLLNLNNLDFLFFNHLLIFVIKNFSLFDKFLIILFIFLDYYNIFNSHYLKNYFLNLDLFNSNDNSNDLIILIRNLMNQILINKKLNLSDIDKILNINNNNSKFDSKLDNNSIDIKDLSFKNDFDIFHNFSIYLSYQINLIENETLNNYIFDFIINLLNQKPYFIFYFKFELIKYNLYHSFYSYQQNYMVLENHFFNSIQLVSFNENIFSKFFKNYDFKNLFIFKNQFVNFQKIFNDFFLYIFGLNEINMDVII
jgi:hypothetical protein